MKRKRIHTTNGVLQWESFGVGMLVFDLFGFSHHHHHHHFPLAPGLLLTLVVSSPFRPHTLALTAMDIDEDIYFGFMANKAEVVKQLHGFSPPTALPLHDERRQGRGFAYDFGVTGNGTVRIDHLSR